MLDYYKLHFWFTVANYISMPVDQAEHHIKDIFERSLNTKKQTPDLSPRLQNALEFYCKVKLQIPDL